MRKRTRLLPPALLALALTAATGLASTAAPTPERGFPFITMRMTHGPLDVPEKMEEVIAVNAARPGSADEYWFAHGAGGALEECERDFRAWLRFVKPCADAGIAVGSQQGVTLGHGSLHNPAGGKGTRRMHPFGDGAWEVDAQGKRLEMFCPRSPEVLAYVEKYTELLCRTLNPVSLWLDDDLRLAVHKADTCFCDHCLAEFNRGRDKPFTRKELVSRLNGGAAKDPIRREWIDFCAESLAAYGAASRRGADKVNPDCLLAYQSVDSSLFKGGRDYFPLLRALAGGKGRRSAIRIGSGCYFENLDDLAFKLINVAREAERCRASGLVAGISYEQENYTREILHKSAEAALTESALALAAGCDALTEYRWDAVRDEPLTDYAEFAAAICAWRPYLERVAAITRRTRLGGLARFVGSDFDLTARYSLADDNDRALAALGIPVSVAQAGGRVWYVDAQTLDEFGAGDGERLFADGAVALVDAKVWGRFLAACGPVGKCAAEKGCVAAFDFASLRQRGVTVPTTAERTAALDALDRLKGATLPVRVERTHRFYVYPRVDGEGRTVAVTFLNGSAGKAPPTKVRVRRPAGKVAVWARPEQTDMLAYAVPGEGDELVVHLPELPGRQVGMLILSDACPETAGEVARVRGEAAVLPAFAPGRWAWTAGYRPLATRIHEGSVKDAVLTDTIEVVAADGRRLVRGRDYVVGEDYGTVALTGEAAKAKGVNPVRMSYAYRLERLDACIRTAEGNVDIRRGVPSVAHPKPPRPRPGETAVGNFWIRGGGRADDGTFFPVDGSKRPAPPPSNAEQAIPKTLRKLRQGLPVTVLAWGDSVTECSYLDEGERWQERFVAWLRAKYPTSEITLVTNGWGAHSLRHFLDAPEGSEHEYERTVLGAKPDLVISEFVNIECGDYDEFARLNDRMLGDFRQRGIEWIALTPNHEAMDWMGLKTLIGSDRDPREYVGRLRRFATERGIGLADAALLWGHLWREGVPSQTLLVNGCNHPDRDGLGLFVEALIDYFPKGE